MQTPIIRLRYENKYIRQKSISRNSIVTAYAMVGTIGLEPMTLCL